MLNRKKSSRIWSLLLVLAMVMGLSLNAFAADNHTATVEIQMYGGTVYTETVTTQDIEDECNGQQHLYLIDDVPVDERGKLLTEYTAADALIEAYILRYHSKPDTDQVDYTWYYNNEPAGHEGWGLYFNVFEGMSSSSVGTYYYVGSRVENGQTIYTYYWEGESWNLYINGEKADLYSSEYAFDTCNTIAFDYNVTRSETFDTTTSIPGAEPAPGN